MRALKILREGNILNVSWDDGHTSAFTMQLLRDECPCAGCKGETILGVVYRPAQLPVFMPGKYDLSALTAVGQYGVAAKWQDGHDTGIYSWEYLRHLCPCPECIASRAQED
ncbi:MAG: DUF971 domain-containing protein [Candidatus Kapaibacterium sp.]|jgi:DUF971 family protein